MIALMLATIAVGLTAVIVVFAIGFMIWRGY